MKWQLLGFTIPPLDNPSECSAELGELEICTGLIWLTYLVNRECQMVSDWIKWLIYDIWYNIMLVWRGEKSSRFIGWLFLGALDLTWFGNEWITNWNLAIVHSLEFLYISTVIWCAWNELCDFFSFLSPGNLGCWIQIYCFATGVWIDWLVSWRCCISEQRPFMLKPVRYYLVVSDGVWSMKNLVDCGSWQGILW